MCRRYTLRRRCLAEVAEALEAEFEAQDEHLYRPRYNSAPTDLGWVIVSCGNARVLRRARWKFLVGANRLLVNIRSESVAAFGRFREIFASGRCAVVSDGFYQWPEHDDEPVWFHAPDDGLVLLGGLLQPAKVRGVPSRFSLLTRPANAVVARVHDRMPVIVDPTDLDKWLTEDRTVARKVLAQEPSRTLITTNVSKYVNNVKHDDPSCVAPRSDSRRTPSFQS